MGSPPRSHEQSYGYPVPQPGQQQPVQTPPFSHQNSYGIQPSQPALAHVPTGNEKHEYQINQAGMQSPQPQPLQHQGSQPLQQGQYNAGAQQKGYQTATPLQALNRSPAPVDCPCCHARALTVTKPSTGNMTHIWGFICFITVCCCCIPYLIDATKDVEHKCGHCGVMLAVWHRWEPDPNTRGTWTIVVSCVITLALSAWTALHLNVPAQQGRQGLRWRKAKWLGLGLIAPEVVAYVAWCQRREARRLARDVREALHHPEPESLWTRLRRSVVCGRKKKQQHTDEASASPAPIGQTADAATSEIPVWTTVHGFYGTMGGFAMSTGSSFLPNDKTRAALTPKGLLFLLEQAPTLFPRTSRADIRDKSKADGVKKTVVCMQAIWFGVNVVTRLAQGLPIALLELNAAAHAICTLVIYAMWWDKPLDVEEPTLLGESKVEANDELMAFMWMASRCSTCGLRSWDLRHRLRDEFDGIWMLGEVHIEDLSFEQQRSAGARSLLRHIEIHYLHNYQTSPPYSLLRIRSRIPTSSKAK
ncbi:MAG: hypothetical protein OHK93_005446 [Ramalina farinacea]|uniref:LITAF domain-containing protein n=1 Tax=Ramalina farinacea TaxID=258253 RepID=A0AA43QGQ9_9LECA|nr:hypothetical protein [Ramalina farinacea]